jgi:hypothetical protein
MGRSAAWRPSIGQRQVTVTDRSKQSVISFAQFAHIAGSVRGISKWVESLIDSQINLICALLETAPQGCSGRSRGR